MMNSFEWRQRSFLGERHLSDFFTSISFEHHGFIFEITAMNGHGKECFFWMDCSEFEQAMSLFGNYGFELYTMYHFRCNNKQTGHHVDYYFLGPREMYSLCFVFYERQCSMSLQTISASPLKSRTPIFMNENLDLIPKPLLNALISHVKSLSIVRMKLLFHPEYSFIEDDER